jgi:V/A-type H+-transporting ATPase subunit F
MRLYLICDNDDTAVGMRLAGIEGTLTSDRKVVVKTLNEVSQDESIGIILINQTLSDMCASEIAEFRKNHSLPLIVEIPDRNSKGTSDTISAYVREAIGIKI